MSQDRQEVLNLIKEAIHNTYVLSVQDQFNSNIPFTESFESYSVIFAEILLSTIENQNAKTKDTTPKGEVNTQPQ